MMMASLPPAGAGRFNAGSGSDLSSLRQRLQSSMAPTPASPTKATPPPLPVVDAPRVAPPLPMAAPPRPERMARSEASPQTAPTPSRNSQRANLPYADIQRVAEASGFVGLNEDAIERAFRQGKSLLVDVRI